MATFPLDQIAIDGGTQARAGTDESTIAAYAEQIAAGTTFPPVILFDDGDAKWLADGWHRFHAHKRAGLTVIAAEVRKGTKRDAILFAVGANATHGLPRTIADKRRSVETLLNDPEWSKWSDRKIATAAGVSHTFVAKMREPATGNVATPTASAKSGNVATRKADSGNVATPVEFTDADNPFAPLVTVNVDPATPVDLPTPIIDLPVPRKAGGEAREWDDYNDGLAEASKQAEALARTIAGLAGFDAKGQASVAYADGLLPFEGTVGPLRILKRTLLEHRIHSKRGSRFITEREATLTAHVANARKVGAA